MATINNNIQREIKKLTENIHNSNVESNALLYGNCIETYRIVKLMRRFFLYYNSIRH